MSTQISPNIGRRNYAWHGVFSPNNSTDPRSLSDFQVALLPVGATDFNVTKSQSSQPGEICPPPNAGSVTVKAVGSPAGIVDDAISSVPGPYVFELLTLIIDETRAGEDSCVKTPSGAGTPSTIRSSYGVTTAMASRIASHSAMSAPISRELRKGLERNGY